MPVCQTAPFLLSPHPLQPDAPAHCIAGTVSRRDGMLRVNYTLEGDLRRLRIPQTKPACFADRLWQHTCFELFIGRWGMECYHEFNFSPSREWAWYAFDRYREPAFQAMDAELGRLTPQISVARAEDKLELTALTPLLPQHAGAALRLGLSAVLEAADDPRQILSYWALVHPWAEPDFHHPDAFMLELDEIRN